MVMRNRILSASLMCLALSAAAGVYLQAGVEPIVQPPTQVLRAQQSSAAAEPVSESQALVTRYCMSCHNERLKRGDMVLEGKDPDHVEVDPETWEKVIRKLNAGTMPPAGRPRPDEETRLAFVAGLEADLGAAAAASPNPGRSGIHRLNRVEYTNAIRDLLALDVDGPALLPPDDSGFGFDNIADALSVSPGLLERYMIAAQTVSRLAVGDPTMAPTADTYPLSFFLLQDQRMSEDLPFGSRGGLAVNHYFPLDGEYVLQIRLQRHAVNLGGAIRGLDRVEHIDVRLDGALVKRFTLGGADPEQTLRGPYQETDLERFADDYLNVRFQAKAGQRVLGVTFESNRWLQEGVGMTRLPVASYGYSSGRISSETEGKLEMGIENIEVRGPFNGTTPESTPSRDRIFVCQPSSLADEEPCARTILSELARRAYRRPVTDPDVDTLLELYRDGRDEGSFETGIQWALERMLVDPDFLFRIERDPANVVPGAPYRLSDLELASRLSFFLWSTIPDDELLEVATRGELRDQSVFEQQVRRMLADPRSSALVHGFFDQWLWQRNLAAQKPDLVEFPEFDENLRAAFERETELFLDSQLREDRSIKELLSANYTFVNERLARHYGVPNVYGTHFRRTTLPDDRRAGLLGQGSLLTVTAYANRTSPVTRGKFLLENVLGVIAPEPPANVPPFPEAPSSEEPPSVRARMELHRTNPVCAACHQQLDPLGFAFENFDGIGGWRTMDGKTEIDASGKLPNGIEFNGPAEFRAAVLQSDAFVGVVTEKLLTYALGRGVEYYDMPVVRQLMQEAADGEYRWSSLILGITQSQPFQMRRSQ